MKPTVFLFDADFDGLSSWYGGVFDPAFLTAFQNADPKGELATAVLRGDTMQSHLVEFVSSVQATDRGRQRSTGFTRSYNMDALVTLSHDIAVSIQSSGNWFSVDLARLSVSLISRNIHCIAIDIDELEIIKAIDREVMVKPWYVGAVQPEIYDPIQTMTFLELLVCDAVIAQGAVHLEQSHDGEIYTEFEGASTYRPNGCEIHEAGWFYKNGFVKPDYHKHHKFTSSAERLQVKMRPSAAQNVVSSLVAAGSKKNSGFSYRLDAVHDERLALEAILPEPKFTKYLFARREKDDKSKWLIEELGIEPKDWRFLAAQLYSALLRQARFEVDVVEFDPSDRNGYRASFSQAVELVSRTGMKMAATAVWQLKPNEIPSLVTIKTGKPKKAPIKAAFPTEVFHPAALLEETHLLDLIRVAFTKGDLAAEATVPTPVFVNGSWHSEGNSGQAVLWIVDEGIIDCIRKLKDELPLKISEKLGVTFRHSLQSADRADAFADAFCRVLWWNNFSCTSETLLD